MKKINLGQKDIIHFVGIGGIGMSGLLKLWIIWVLKFKEAIKIKIKIQLVAQNLKLKSFIGHSSNNLKKANILVKSQQLKITISKLNMQKKIKYLFTQEQKF